jgi:hypothetical protein
MKDEAGNLDSNVSIVTVFVALAWLLYSGGLWTNQDNEV